MMMRSTTRSDVYKTPCLALALIAAGLLAGCETDGTGPSAAGAPTVQTAMAPTAPEPGKPADAKSEPAKPEAKPVEPAKPVEAAKPAEPPKPAEPMTRSRAASQCWMSTEKGSAKTDLDKRADIVTKCIDDKMKAAPKT
jgi:outer membrane biosynthesis protein TonB